VEIPYDKKNTPIPPPARKFPALVTGNESPILPPVKKVKLKEKEIAVSENVKDKGVKRAGGNAEAGAPILPPGRKIARVKSKVVAQGKEAKSTTPILPPGRKDTPAEPKIARSKKRKEVEGDKIGPHESTGEGGHIQTVSSPILPPPRLHLWPTSPLHPTKLASTKSASTRPKGKENIPPKNGDARNEKACNRCTYRSLTCDRGGLRCKECRRALVPCIYGSTWSFTSPEKITESKKRKRESGVIGRAGEVDANLSKKSKSNLHDSLASKSLDLDQDDEGRVEGEGIRGSSRKPASKKIVKITGSGSPVPETPKTPVNKLDRLSDDMSGYKKGNRSGVVSGKGVGEGKPLFSQLTS